MHKYWSRDDTKNWYIQLENRIEDIDYYLRRTIDWCNDQGVENERTIFMCSFLTCIWVSSMRGEMITYLELMEMLGIEEIPKDEEKFYELDPIYANMDHDELLERVVQMSD